MEKIPRHIDIDYSKYAPDIPEDRLEAYYGLPKHVQFCKECVMSNQKPNSCYEFEHTINSIKKTMVIQEDGVCDACHACHNKANGHIDWALREKELRELCDQYRKNDGSYDCLVPGSGGKDSFYAAHLLKYKYGMHPLTVTWAPHIYTPWGWENMQAWIHAGFDNYLCTPNGMTHRLLTRLATENLFHPFQPFILGQKQLAPKMAAKFGIPLVFYGENEAEFGNPIADNNSALRDEHFFAVNDYDHIYLGGVSLRQLEEDYKVDKADLAIYLPSETSNLEKNHIQVRYLGYYEKWHPQGAYYYSVEHGGFRPAPERTQGTYSKYNSIDDKIDDFFYYTTYIKYGIGRTTYDAAQEIRNAIAFIEEHTGEKWDWKYYFECAKRVNISTKYRQEWLDMNKTDYPQVFGSNLALYTETNYMAICGKVPEFIEADRKIARLAEQAYAKKKRMAKEYRHRAIVWGVQSHFYMDFLLWLLNCWGIVPLTDMLSMVSTKELVEEDTPENREQAIYDMAWLTENMIMRNRTHGGYKVLLDELWEFCEEFNADMVILWEHMSCKALDGMHGQFEEKARQLGIHLVWVSHDLFDPRIINRQGIRDQINRYMRSVMREEPIDPTLEVIHDENSW